MLEIRQVRGYRAAAGLPEDRITVVLEEVAAAPATIARATTDDLIVLMVDRPTVV